MRLLRWSFLIASLLALFSISACTENERAKNFGGKMTVDLPVDQKLVTATWKDDNLWYLTRQMRQGEVAEKYEFKENSSFGIIQGAVIFQEHTSK